MTQDPISETYLGLRLEQWLKDAIEECAAKDSRTASNWARMILEEAVEKQLKKK